MNFISYRSGQQVSCLSDKYLDALDYVGGTILLVKYINVNFMWDTPNILKVLLLYNWAGKFTIIGSSQPKSCIWLDTQIDYPLGYLEVEGLKHSDLLLHMNMTTGTIFERLLKGDL
jgi:hypothetical protein